MKPRLGGFRPWRERPWKIQNFVKCIWTSWMNTSNWVTWAQQIIRSRVSHTTSFRINAFFGLKVRRLNYVLFSTHQVVPLLKLRWMKSWWLGRPFKKSCIQHFFVFVCITMHLRRTLLKCTAKFSCTKKNFQLVVWRRHPSEPLQIFRLNTVTYGTAPAPFLATRCLQMLSDANTHMYPLGSKAIKRDFYVDDLLTGSDNFESLDLIRSEVVKILNSAGFNLS